MPLTRSTLAWRRFGCRRPAVLAALAAAVLAWLLTAAAAAGAPPAGRNVTDVVLIHGLGANVEIWREITPHLSGMYHVVRYELHGHGKTKPLPNATIDSEVEALGRWLAEQNLVTPDLIGHGIGGMIAMKYALTHPQSVRSLVVIDAGPRQLLDDEQKVAIARSLLEDYDRFVASRFIGISEVPQINELAVDMALRTDSASFVSLLLSSFDWDLTDLLPRQTMPLLLLASEAFLPSASEAHEHLAIYGFGGARELRFRRLDGTGHYLMLEQPSSVAATLLIWLRSQED